ncbi:DUF1294 domain-containing protein [Domibacillus indicus]|uniref:DUF1294 domain-containing protein n=1 Tax=Domibacillus indicus TaxID=1437523 RepID=UPI0009E60108|nr:DUF1294 domain-containing protein [Domibacillus indicus]
MSIIFFYFIAINFTTYVVMGNDKKKARENRYRTSERTLWLLALAGGAPGGYTAMQAYRHKTRHSSFKYGMPVLAVIDLVVLAMIGGTAI